MSQTIFFIYLGWYIPCRHILFGTAGSCLSRVYSTAVDSVTLAQNEAPPLCCKHAVGGKALSLCAGRKLFYTSETEIQAAKQGKAPLSAFGAVCAGISLRKAAGSSVRVRGYAAAHGTVSPPAGKPRPRLSFFPCLWQCYITSASQTACSCVSARKGI